MPYYSPYVNISELCGKTLKRIYVSDDEILFYTADREIYKMFHDQDCCEQVYIEDIVGDINDLIGYPILIAEESCSSENPDGVQKKYQDSFTWTFYKFATIKGYVDIRWYGESNGYYSESVDFVKMNAADL
jgi:hypothetical protein